MDNVQFRRVIFILLDLYLVLSETCPITNLIICSSYHVVHHSNSVSYHLIEKFSEIFARIFTIFCLLLREISIQIIIRSNIQFIPVETGGSSRLVYFKLIIRPLSKNNESQNMLFYCNVQVINITVRKYKRKH